MVGTSEASVISPRSSSARTRSASKRSWTTAVVALIAHAQEDGQAADVEERQRAQPAVGAVRAQGVRARPRALAWWLA